MPKAFRIEFMMRSVVENDDLPVIFGDLTDPCHLKPVINLDLATCGKQQLEVLAAI